MLVGGTWWAGFGERLGGDLTMVEPPLIEPPTATSGGFRAYLRDDSWANSGRAYVGGSVSGSPNRLRKTTHY